jgi:hypothetical protein
MSITIKANTSAFTRAVDRYLENSKKTRPEYMKQQARLIAKNVIAITPPSGFYKTKENDSKSMVMGKKAEAVGKRAILNDLLRIFYVMKPENIEKFLDFYGSGGNTSEFGHAGAKAIGNVTEKVLTSQASIKSWHQARRTRKGRTMNVHRDVTTGIRFRDLPGLDMGIVSQKQFQQYYKSVAKKVGYLVSGWESTAKTLGFSMAKWMTGHGCPSTCEMKITSFGVFIKATNGASYASEVNDLLRRVEYALNWQTKQIEKQIRYYEEKMHREAGLKA